MIPYIILGAVAVVALAAIGGGTAGYQAKKRKKAFAAQAELDRIAAEKAAQEAAEAAAQQELEAKESAPIEQQIVQPQPIIIQQAAAPKEEKKEETKFCSFCRCEMPIKNRFCPNCGKEVDMLGNVIERETAKPVEEPKPEPAPVVVAAPVQEEKKEATKTCSNCHYEMPVVNHFCPNCGKEVDIRGTVIEKPVEQVKEEPVEEEKTFVEPEMKNVGWDDEFAPNSVIIASVPRKTFAENLADASKDVRAYYKEIMEYALAKEDTRESEAQYAMSVLCGRMKLMQVMFQRGKLICKFMAGSSELKKYSQSEKTVKIKEKPVIVEIDSKESVDAAKELIDISHKNIQTARNKDAKPKKEETVAVTEDKPKAKKKAKKSEPVEKTEEKAEQTVVVAESTPVSEPVQEEVKEEPTIEPVQEEVVVEPVKEEPVSEPVQEEKTEEVKEEEPVKKAPAKKAAPAKKTEKKVAKGKWLIEHKSEGEYMAKLAASNGEVMLSSEIYTSEDGARAGIDTIIKNTEIGNFIAYQNKNGNYYYKLKTANNKLLCVGEIYKTKEQCLKAIESVKRIAADAVVAGEIIEDAKYVDYTPEKDIKYEVKTKSRGKWKVEETEEGMYSAKLYASNGQLMLATEEVSTKATAKKAIASVKKYSADGNFIIDRDKFGRFYYKLRNAQKSVVCIGEAYDSKESCISALESVRKFAAIADIAADEPVAE